MGDIGRPLRRVVRVPEAEPEVPDDVPVPAEPAPVPVREPVPA